MLFLLVFVSMRFLACIAMVFVQVLKFSKWPIPCQLNINAGLFACSKLGLMLSMTWYRLSFQNSIKVFLIEIVAVSFSSYGLVFCFQNVNDQSELVLVSYQNNWIEKYLINIHKYKIVDILANRLLRDREWEQYKY